MRTEKEYSLYNIDKYNLPHGSYIKMSYYYNIYTIYVYIFL